MYFAKLLLLLVSSTPSMAKILPSRLQVQDEGAGKAAAGDKSEYRKLHEAAVPIEEEPAAAELEADNQPVTPQIVGGKLMEKGRRPYLVSLHDQDDVFLWRVTNIAEGGSGCCSAYLNRYDLEEENCTDQISHTVSEMMPHPKYDGRTKNHDLAVLVLSEAVTSIDPVEFNSNSSKPVDNQTLEVLGYRKTSYNARKGETKPRTVTVKAEAYEVCKKAYANFQGVIGDSPETNVMICAGTPPGAKKTANSCTGDSGGPLVINNHTGTGKDLQVGVFSAGVGCGAPQFPGLYAMISADIQWIRNKVCKYDRNWADPEWCTTMPTYAPIYTPTIKPTGKPTREPTRKSDKVSKATHGSLQFIDDASKSFDHDEKGLDELV